MLVTPEQVSNYMGGIELTDEMTASLNNDILPGIQSDLEDYLHRPVEPVHVRETLDITSRGTIVFSIAPVWNIIALTRTSDNVAVPFTQFIPPALPVSNSEERIYDPAGLGSDAAPFEFYVGAYGGAYPNVGEAFLSLGGSPVYDAYVPSAYFQSRQFQITAEYRGGYYGIADKKIKLAIIRVAAREAERQFADNIAIADGTADNAKTSDSRVKGWTQDELKQFDRLRRRVSA